MFAPKCGSRPDLVAGSFTLSMEGSFRSSELSLQNGGFRGNLLGFSEQLVSKPSVLFNNMFMKLVSTGTNTHVFTMDLKQALTQFTVLSSSTGQVIGSTSSVRLELSHL